MSNAYNTPAYRDYVEHYTEDFPLMEEEVEAGTLHELAYTLVSRTYGKIVDGGIARLDGTPITYAACRDIGELTITDREGGTHTFAITDRPLRPIALTLCGRDLILLRRDLYGYTLLDAADLTVPLLDYFPSAVLDGEEMFIFCYAYPFGDLIVLEGCYWAVPYGQVFVLDPATGRALNLNQAAGILDVFDRSVVTGDDTLTLRGRHMEGDDLDHGDEGVIDTFTLSEIHDLLHTHGQTDL